MTQEKLSQVKHSHISKVKLGNEASINVEGMGDLKLDLEQSSLTLKDVLFVPQLSNNLMSVSGLLDSNYDVLFQSKDMSCKILRNNEEIGYAIRYNNLWYIVPNHTASCNLGTAEEDINLWHLRTNHLNHQAVSQCQGLVPGIPNFRTRIPEQCIGCAMGKQTRLPFPSVKEPQSSRILELIHTDVIGPISGKPVDYEDRRYLLTLIDDFSKKSWVYLLCTKGEVAETIQR